MTRVNAPLVCYQSALFKVQGSVILNHCPDHNTAGSDQSQVPGDSVETRGRKYSFSAETPIHHHLFRIFTRQQWDLFALADYFLFRYGRVAFFAY